MGLFRLVKILWWIVQDKRHARIPYRDSSSFLTFGVFSDPRAKPRACQKCHLLSARLPHQNKPDMTMTLDRKGEKKVGRSYHDHRHSRIK